MSYGMFTVLRTELQDPATLRQKLEDAVGDAATAGRLTAELAAAAAADGAASTWHIVPDDTAAGAGGWRIEPMDAA